MKRIHLFLAGLVAIAISACSTEPNSEGVMEMDAKLSNSTVTAVAPKGGDHTEGGETVSEIRIESVRMLLSRLKLKRTTDDTVSGGKDVKTGPAVVTFEDGTAKIIFRQLVPNGTYDRVKLEKHKFSSSEVASYTGDPVFGEFVEPDRATLIIEGSIIANGTETPFVIRDDSTENLWIEFDPVVTINEDSDEVIDLLFDASLVFQDGSVLLDPFNAKDMGQISKNLKKAFRLQNRK